MQKITITRGFRFADLWEVHGRAYSPGDYAVVERPAAPNECSPECAKVALAEGWAHEAEVEKAARPTGSRTGEAAPSASSRPARRSRKSKPTK